MLCEGNASSSTSNILASTRASYELELSSGEESHGGECLSQVKLSLTSDACVRVSCGLKKTFRW